MIYPPGVSGGSIDENRNGTPDSNLIARAERRTNSLGPDGSVWIIELRANRIGRLKDESFEEYEVPRDNPMLSGLAVASDGVVWFAMLHSSSLGRLGDGRVDIFGLPRDGARPCSIAIDATGNVWYPDISGYVGMLPGARGRRELREPRHSDGACPILLGLLSGPAADAAHW